MSGGRLLLLGGVGALVAAQLIRIETTNPPVSGNVAAPAAIDRLLRRACYDCHSHETAWPWYSQVAPVSWLTVHDVHEGRHELNFSTWDTLPEEQRRKRMKESAEEIRAGEMPPWSYRLMHPEARLSPTEQNALIQWVTEQAAH